MWAWFNCFFRRHHNPVRHPLGGFRCAECGTMGVDLREMGFTELGSVTRGKGFYSRDERASWTR
jgi:hypothetical protein